mmetsp:Transcript_38293/g.94826  ORF Transcript_38293/g.94826 Transcript_38293/m.94826 type:complete len:307 (+) Transcript_38293:505-1425(+)
MELHLHGHGAVIALLVVGVLLYEGAALERVVPQRPPAAVVGEHDGHIIKRQVQLHPVPRHGVALVCGARSWPLLQPEPPLVRERRPPVSRRVHGSRKLEAALHVAQRVGGCRFEQLAASRRRACAAGRGLVPLGHYHRRLELIELGERGERLDALSARRRHLRRVGRLLEEGGQPLEELAHVDVSARDGRVDVLLHLHLVPLVRLRVLELVLLCFVKRVAVRRQPLEVPRCEFGRLERAADRLEPRACLTRLGARKKLHTSVGEVRVLPPLLPSGVGDWTGWRGGRHSQHWSKGANSQSNIILGSL